MASRHDKPAIPVDGVFIEVGSNPSIELATQLGVAEPLADQRLPAAASWGGLRPGTRIARGEALFPRLDD